MSKRWSNFLLLVGSGVVVMLGVVFGNDQQYYLVSLGLIILSWVPMYIKYENKAPPLKRIVVLAVMISLTVSSRVVFALTPNFKPMSVMIILCGVVFGKEDGYICGSLSALLSNFFFGQGPWTPFQMLAWGLIGYMAGYIKKENGYLLYGYAVISGIVFSLIMDLWSILAYDTTFTMNRYITYALASMPMVVIYCVANVFFMYLLKDVCIAKLSRIQTKYKWEIEK